MLPTTTGDLFVWLVGFTAHHKSHSSGDRFVNRRRITRFKCAGMNVKVRNLCELLVPFSRHASVWPCRDVIVGYWNDKQRLQWPCSKTGNHTRDDKRAKRQQQLLLQPLLMLLIIMIIVKYHKYSKRCFAIPVIGKN